MDAVFCTACGGKNDLDSTYCAFCGQRLFMPRQHVNETAESKPKDDAAPVAGGVDTASDTAGTAGATPPMPAPEPIRQAAMQPDGQPERMAASTPEPGAMSATPSGNTGEYPPAFPGRTMPQSEPDATGRPPAEPSPPAWAGQRQAGPSMAQHDARQVPRFAQTPMQTPTRAYTAAPIYSAVQEEPVRSAAPQPHARSHWRMRIVLFALATALVTAILAWYFVLVPNGILTFGLGRDDTSVEQAGSDSDSDDDSGSITGDDTSDTEYPGAQQVIDYAEDGRYEIITGTYCRTNGACISISKSTSSSLTDEEGDGIDPEEWIGAYPFSPYSKHLTIDLGWNTGEDLSSYTASVPFMLYVDQSSCALGSGEDMISTCWDSSGNEMALDIYMYYIPAGADVDRMKDETAAIIDGDDPDTSRPYLLFQIQAASNSRFDASDDAVFYYEW